MSFIPIPCPPASGSGPSDPGFDVEEVFYLCDVVAGDIVGTAVAVFTYDAETGLPVGPPSYVDPVTGAVYVPVGTLQPCPSGSTAEFVLCDIQPDGSSTQFIRKLIQSPSGLVLEVQDQLLDGNPYVTTGTVADCDPYSTCNPPSNQDLNADCGPGESPNLPLIIADGQASNSTVNDDPTADPLCGGTWAVGPDAQSAPFPVNESFRNATFDQPGPVTQGTAPYAGLTADPAFTGSNAGDTPGNGWLQTSDLNSGTNGLWQVPTPFPTNEGATLSATFASHDGTAYGGDGMMIVFTDGSVAPQAAAVGGGGGLGHGNWTGGYAGVVLDEYGAFGGHENDGNRISIVGVGPVNQNVFATAQVPLAPHFINQTTRTQPARLTASIITEGGQTYMSASVDWNDGLGPIQYFDRVNVTPFYGVAPPTLRMALYGGSGGAFRSEHEWRDAQAIASGIQEWRAFPITTDPIPACVTQVSIHAEVDHTFVSDTQTAGNTDNEAWFWLVNTATNTIVDRAQVSSVPTTTGIVDTLTLDSGLIPVGDLANYRIYVGSETRDENGNYGHLWENLVIDVIGSGCPVTPRRTLEISAICPIPVTIVGGGGDDGGGGAPAVFNAPATFEDAPICITVAGVNTTGFRREIRTPDGNIVIQYTGTDGIPMSPDSWIPGPCPQVGVDTQKVCDLGSSTTLIARYEFDSNGVLTETLYYTLDGTGPVAPIGPLSEGGCCDPFDLGESCYDSGGGVIRRVRGERRCDPSAPPAFTLFFYDTETGDLVPSPVFVDCPGSGNVFQHEEILCDTVGPFLRKYIQDAAGLVTSVVNVTLAGAPYVPVGAVDVCPIEVTVEPTEFEFEEEILCDDNGPFFRRTIFNTGTQTYSPPVDFTLAGAPYVTVGTVTNCGTTIDSEQQILCDDGAADVEFLRTYTYINGTGPVTVDTELDGTTPYVVVGEAVVCGECCPITIGEGCTSVGSGTYVSIRNPDGTITTIDPITGTPVLPGDIVPCVQDVNPVQVANLIDSTVQRQTGAGAINILAGARSITVTVITGTPTVQIGGDPIVTLVPGITLTWSVDDRDESLLNAFTFTGLAGHDFYVITTRL